MWQSVNRISWPALCGLGLMSIAPAARADAQPEVPPPRACEIAAPIDPQSHPPTIDCSFVEDTGYVSGDAYTITVFHIDDKPVEIESGNAFYVMREAAAADGVDIHIVSGFRTMSQQEYLYGCYVNCNCNNCNLAATPGYSNHQSGHAFDVNTTGYGGAVYDWLAANGASFGFANTVAGEPWHWEWWEGGPGGGVCLVNSPPQGSFDAAACEGIEGWARDPDQPDVATDVQLYFDGPADDEATTTVSLTADESRPDLCDVLAGDCDHGFSMPMPMSLRDGTDHAVAAYARDLGGEEDSLLYDHTFACDPPELVGGLREVDELAFEAWRFDAFFDLAPADPASVDATGIWVPIEASPRLVQVDGQPDVWLVDAGMRRHVPHPKVARAWGFDLSTVELVDDATLQAWPQWEPLRETPLLVTASDGTIYLVDDAMIDDDDDDDDGTSGGPDGEPSGTSSGPDGDPSGPQPTGGDTDGGVALPGSDDEGAGGCSAAGASGTGSRWAPLLLLLGAIRIHRGRRRRRSTPAA